MNQYINIYISHADMGIIVIHLIFIAKWGSWVSLEPPFEPKIFNFHGEFSEKSGKNYKYSCEIKKSNPLRKFEPPIKKSWIRPCKCLVRC